MSAGWPDGCSGPSASQGSRTLTLFRSSLELPGTLLILLLGVVIVAVVGGVAPAAVAVVIALGLGDFYFTVPFHTFRMTQPSEIAALIVFGAVAAVVSALVDRLARRSSQINRSQAEAEALARLAGGAVLAAAEPLPNLVSELRRTFGLDAVAVLEADGDGWRPIAAAGAPVPARPEDAPVAAELAPGTVLVLSGSMLSAEDRRLLGAFVAQLRLAQERGQLQAQAASATELEEANSLRTACSPRPSRTTCGRRSRRSRPRPRACSPVRSTGLPEQVQDFVKMIDVEADRLTHLVSNLLDMSRLQTGAVKIVARRTKLEDVIYSAVGTLGAGAARVVIDGPDPSPVVETDAGLLERVIANIVDNALAWSPEGDVVRVEAALIGDHADVRVIDHGPGIPLDQREQVFEPFQRLGDGRGTRPTASVSGWPLHAASCMPSAVTSRSTTPPTAVQPSCSRSPWTGRELRRRRAQGHGAGRRRRAGDLAGARRQSARPRLRRAAGRIRYPSARDGGAPAPTRSCSTSDCPT